MTYLEGRQAAEANPLFFDLRHESCQVFGSLRVKVHWKGEAVSFVAPLEG
jgi:hypothetical protein